MASERKGSAGGANSGKGWALVTGASGGIGRELARAFASRGYDLILAARNEEALAALAQELGAAHCLEDRNNERHRDNTVNQSYKQPWGD